MASCPNCGAQVSMDSRFCSYCGTEVHPEAGTIAPSVYTGEGYGVMLLDLGNCGQVHAENLLSDTCGYTGAEAMVLLSRLPTFIAQNLLRDQAVYLAQALTEYGMHVAVYDKNGNRSLSSDLSSVFDSTGSLLTRVAGVLGLIGLRNRITHAVRRLTLPQPPIVYRMPTVRPAPPPRRHAVHAVPDPASVPSLRDMPGPGSQNRPARVLHRAGRHGAGGMGRGGKMGGRGPGRNQGHGPG